MIFRTKHIDIKAYICAFLILLMSGFGFAQDETGIPELVAHKIAGGSADRIRVDGFLSEEIWQRAEVISVFYQREPFEGKRATEKTEVRVIYDEESLYVGLIAHDRKSGAIISRILQRDKIMTKNFEGKPRFAGDDAVAILFDPFHDHRNAMVFATNPNGAKFDALITEEGVEFNIDWRAVWDVAAQRIPEGWSIEFAIPFRTLRYPSNPGSVPWGFNIYRMIRHKNEEVLWSSWSQDNQGFERVSRAGHLFGMENLQRQKVNLELKPYSLTGMSREFDIPTKLDTDLELDAGMDAKWEINPGLLLDLTVNTDFAQVEADDEQVNLTRFDLFFPEKRDFFLENAGVFGFGFRGFFEPPPFLLFFSRRIGIHEDGQVPVKGGARLTGRMGKQTVGFLNVLTGSAFGEPRTNFAVSRVKRDVGDRNYVGAIITDRRNSDSTNTTAGVDWSFWPTSALNIKGFAAGTYTSVEGGDDHAYSVGLNYGSNVFGFNGQIINIGPEARADIGFITRTDIRRIDGLTRITIRPLLLGLRSLNLFYNGLYLTNFDFDLRDRNSGVALNPIWNSGDEIGIFYFDNFTHLDEEFELTDDITISPKDYDSWLYGMFGSTSQSRSVTFNTENSYSRFFDGNLLSLSAKLGLSVGSNLSFNLGYTHNEVDVPEGSFDTELVSFRGVLALSTNLVANTLVQYNSLDKTFSTNIRINYIHSPGSDLFIVYNEEHGAEDDVWDLVSRGAILKLTFLKRF